MKSDCVYLERPRDFEAVEAEVALATDALATDAFFFLFSKLSLTAANNTADISGARLTMSPPFVFLGDEVFFLVADFVGFADFADFADFAVFVGIFSIIIRIN